MVSIVMTYYNRKEQLLLTLASIRKFGDPEIIIVDDGSHEQLSVDARVIRIDPKDKWYYNPCVPYNIGFSHVKNDVVIIQNPECLHTGDILSCADKIEDDMMFTFGAYSLDYHLKIKPEEVRPAQLRYHILNNERQGVQISHHGWYNHSFHRPVGFHFCNMLTRKTLEKIGGFDERFANGIARDDDEILLRIKRAGIRVIFVDDPFVIHQKHERTNYRLFAKQRQINEDLYNKVLTEDYIKPPQNHYYGIL